jgi:hypothetical protein
LQFGAGENEVSSVYVHSVGIAAPGLLGWPTACKVLSGETEYQPDVMPKLVPSLLPANERRRTTPMIKLSLCVAEEAMNIAGDTQNLGGIFSTDLVCSVFGSSDGDLEIVHKICTALLMPGRPVSPTQFHNSVHNAAAGYWDIATASSLPSISLSAADATFSAGMLEAVTMATIEKENVLLVVYGYPAPEPLNSIAPMSAPFGVALLLSATHKQNAMAKITVEEICDGQPDTMSQSTVLDSLCTGNIAAAGLPLLELIARNEAGAILLPYAQNSCLRVRCQPCP